MKKIAILLAALALAGCETAPPEKPVVPNVPVLPEKQQVVIPTGLTDACPPLTPLGSASYSQGMSVDALKVWFNQYDLCAGRFAQFVTVVTPALNIKEVNPQITSGLAAPKNPQSGQ